MLAAVSTHSTLAAKVSCALLDVVLFSDSKQDTTV